MGKIDTIKTIEKSKGKIDPLYDLMFSDVVAIRDISKDDFDIACDSFRFGYMQGRKAAFKEMEKKGL